MSAPTPKEIRDAYKDYRNDWEDIRAEAQSDMQAISTEGPWSAEDRDQREDAGRPCIHLDLINQYLNQTKGNVRKSKRAVQAIPKGDGANDQDAKVRSSAIMGIEEKSQAQPIYLNAFECMIERGYGYAVIRTEYKDHWSFDQDIIIKPIMNPDTVLLSPFYKQPDASDVPDGFLLDLMTRAAFKKKFPKSRITDFTDEVMGEQGVRDWITEKNVQIAEYWKVDQIRSKLLLIETESGPEVFTEDDWKQAQEFGLKGSVKRERTVESPKVTQYMTNGLEILDEIPWAGSRIPIISCFGPERWTTKGGQAKRQLLSMVRFARDPQMLFDYLATQECEEAGMVPKVPFIGYKGQFESDSGAWGEINKVPHSFMEVDLVLDSGAETLPIPQRPQWQPNFQEYEIAKDSASRSVQSAMGITPLPTAAARRNEKSGVALEKIDSMESIGGFPFVDRYENGFLHNMGWQLNELIEPILDTQRELPIAKPDGTRTSLTTVGNTSHPLDDSGAYDVQGLPENHLHTGKGDFDVTISTGPSYQSEREEQSAFVDQLIENLPNLPPPGTPAATILALAIRMRPDLGPIGEQIADVLMPPDPNNLPPQAQAIVAQLNGQLQQVKQENAQLQMEKAAKMMEQQGKMQIEQIRGQHKLDAETMKLITSIIDAKIAAKMQSAEMQSDAELDLLGFHHDMQQQGAQQAHEHAMAGVTHQQNLEAGAQQAQNAQQQQQTQIAADQQSQANQEQSQ